MLGQVGCLALAIYFEARSENLQGQIFVAETVVNRVESKRYPNTHCGVVFQYKQFSFLNDVYDKKKPLYIKNKKAWNESVKLAYKYVTATPDVHDACHYARHEISNKWTKHFDLAVKVGSHSFYDGGCK